MRVPYVNLGAQHIQIKDELLAAAEKVVTSGMFILGEYVKAFEEQFALLCGTRYAVGVNSGTDALVLAMKVYGIGNGDEVITAPNSFLASASAIILAGATPVFVDVSQDQNIDTGLLEAKITNKTKAIMPVHLTGRPAEMNEINSIAKQHGLLVIEDAAQAVNATYYDKKVGSLGDIGCFSLHPLKNLNALGDGGMITTNDESIYNELLKLRNHGLRNRDECEVWSFNTRLDALQAAMLSVKIKYLESWEKRRIEIADYYRKELKGLVFIPELKPYMKHVYHAFVVQTDVREQLMKYLGEKGIDTKVHYPIPIHLQDAAKSLKTDQYPNTEKQMQEILSLPVYPELTDEQVSYVASSIKGFFQS